MDYLDIDEEISRICIADDWGKAAEIAQMASAFPNLRLFRDYSHHGLLRYSSPDVNSEVDQLDVMRGEVLAVGLYAVIDSRGSRLYSYPPVFEIGDQNHKGFGYLPRPGWREAMEEAGFSRHVIDQVQDLLDRHPPVNYMEDGNDQESREGD